MWQIKSVSHNSSGLPATYCPTVQALFGHILLQFTARSGCMNKRLRNRKNVISCSMQGLYCWPIWKSSSKTESSLSMTHACYTCLQWRPCCWWLYGFNVVGSEAKIMPALTLNIIIFMLYVAFRKLLPFFLSPFFILCHSFKLPMRVISVQSQYHLYADMTDAVSTIFNMKKYEFQLQGQVQ